MNSTHPNRSCPQCEQPLPADAPEGLCPECLMLGALETMPMPEHLKPSGRLPELGEVFGGYRIGRELGRGGMGAVFEAEQLDTGRVIALKLLNHQLDSPEARARFLREGRLAASINHPNSVYVFGTEEIGEMPAISMELVGGGTLEEIVKARGALPIGEAVDMISQVVEGLEAAEEIGILHRDVKPGNCFQDVDGTVKIGDFGLSISTEARDENHLTMDGTIFGTPAFSSPEQLRGDELNVQSDIYAVGATLFYLLTGKAAFGGKSVAQLFANVLESKPPSPKEKRADLPEALAAIVLRCLRKIPSERFSSYLELRKALAPFKSDAPAPANPGLRFLAGAADWMMYTCIAMMVQIVLHGGLMSPEQMETSYMLKSFVVSLFCWTLYFGLLEGRAGFSLWKGVCRLRVTDQNGNPPGFAKGALRGFLMLLLPSIPMWIAVIINPTGFAPGGSSGWSLVIGFSFYIIIALLFSTMRRRNGFASMIDLLTGTRVIRRKSFQNRPAFAHESDTPIVAGDDSKTIGPYHVIDTLSKGDDSEWLVGYDTRLLRKIWIRTVPEGTPSVVQNLRKLGRVGRLRWLAERRESGDNWDAYESPGGDALLNIVAKKQPTWEQMRYWLLDLSAELAIAEKDDTIPEELALDRIWITSSGRAKLLDFPIVEVETEVPLAASPEEFLRQVSDLVKQPMPLHAIALRERMNAGFAPLGLAREIRPLLERATSTSGQRRFALIAGCVAFPLLIAIMTVFGLDMVQRWQRENPEVFSLQQAMTFRTQSRWDIMKGTNPPSDELFSIYVANHYRDLVNSEAWNGTTALMFVQGPNRVFAEKSLKEFPNPSDEEIAKADAAIDQRVKEMEGSFDNIPKWTPLIVGASGLVFYVAFPAILASLICRGGLVMLICGVGVARKDGTKATRLRCFWRSLVTWSPWVVIPIMLAMLVPSLGIQNAWIFGGLIVILSIISLMLPNRSLQDRIAGTYLVNR